MNRLFLASAVFAFLTVTIVPVRGATVEDEAAIRSVVGAQQQDAWNRHESKIYAGLFTEDCDVVNLPGWRWKGRDELERKLAAGYAFVFRDTTLTIGVVDVRFLSRDIAVAHAAWTMSGAHTPPGIPEPRMGIQTLVLQKPAGKWLIAVFQNTASSPETPFPATAPKS